MNYINLFLEILSLHEECDRFIDIGTKRVIIDPKSVDYELRQWHYYFYKNDTIQSPNYYILELKNYYHNNPENIVAKEFITNYLRSFIYLDPKVKNFFHYAKLQSPMYFHDLNKIGVSYNLYHYIDNKLVSTKSRNDSFYNLTRFHTSHLFKSKFLWF